MKTEYVIRPKVINGIWNYENIHSQQQMHKRIVPKGAGNAKERTEDVTLPGGTSRRNAKRISSR